MLLPGAQAISQAGTAAPLRPSGIAFDGAGDLYFTDAGRHCVYEVTVAGVLSLFAGTGTQGYGGDGGPASAARLNEPQGIVVGADGTVYIADTGNSRVRAVRGNVISTIAGQGVPGYSGDGGVATMAQLNRPGGLALATDGSLYIADAANERVRVLRAGVITTVAGNGVQGFSGDGGPATQAELDGPESAAIGPDGRLFIADAHNGRLRVVSSDGAIATFAGTGVEGFSGDAGPALQAELSRPAGVAVDASGAVYLADSGNHRVRKVDPAGLMTTIGGTGVQGAASEGTAASSASLDGPTGLAISPLGVLWLADPRHATVRAVNGEGLLFQPAGLVARQTSVQSQVASSAYGQASVSVSVAGQAGLAQGQVRVRENGVLLSAAPLVKGSVAVTLPSLGSGTHTLAVEYSGDLLNPAATTSLNSVVITPGVLIATADAATMRFGEAVPALGGTFSGLSSQDSGQVQVSFLTTATSLSGVGRYAITPVLQGPAASRYVVQLNSGSGQLSVTPGQSTTAVLTPLPQGYDGLPLSLSATVAAAAKGVPTGSVSFLENGSVLATANLVNGSATGVLSALSAGPHAVEARYSGDGNFTGSDSSLQTIAVNVLPDFTLTQVSAAAPTMDPGTAASFTFQVAASPAPFTGVVAFATAGLPTGWTARFAPPNVVPGVGSASVVLTVTASGTAEQRWHSSSTLAFAALVVPCVFWRRRRWMVRCQLALLSTVMLGTTACGDRVASTADIVAPHAASFTVSATATNLAGQVITHTSAVSYLQP